MKLLHTICAALMMVAITSCDEHREFPDTAMKTCDILCTDGKVVRYEDMKSQGKQPIAVVFHINQNNETQGTGYAVYLWDIAPEAYSDSIGVKHNTSANITAFDGNMNTHSMYSSGYLQLPLLSLICGNMDRVPTYHQWPRYVCFMGQRTR